MQNKFNKAKRRSSIQKLTLSAVFLAIGLVLPLVTGQIKAIGNMLQPMHIPVMLCGIVCGWGYGAVVGFTMPLLRSVIFSMPKIYPNAAAMAFELMTYGLVIGIMYKLLPKKNYSIYIALITAMILGRAVWGIAYSSMLALSGSSMTWKMFATSAFLNSIPGIIIQFILIPLFTAFLRKHKYIK